MKINRLFKIILFVIIGFYSCEVLDEDPFVQTETENFYQNSNDALDGLTSAYARLKSGNGYYKQKYLSTLFAASDQGLSTFLLNDFKNGNVTSSNPYTEDIWIDIYKAIRDANNVIAKVPSIDMDESLKFRIIGEAKFLRALHYFNLVRCFSEIPLRLVPVEADINEGLPISSISEIYDSITSDLEYAANFCWDRNETRNGETNNLGRVTKAAANAMLAKVYLRMASCKRTAMAGIEGNIKYLELSESPFTYYQRAADKCDAALLDSGFMLSGNLDQYISIFEADNGNNHEMLFEVQGSDEIGQGTAVSNLFTPRNAGLSGTGFGGSNKLKGRFINFHLNKNDPRFQNSIIKEYQTCRIFEIYPGSTGYKAFFPIACSSTITSTNNNNWPFTFLIENYLDNPNASEHIFKINVNRLPEGGASYRRVEMDEYNQPSYGLAEPLTIGINTITSSSANNKLVEVQFDNSDICFTQLILNEDDDVSDDVKEQRNIYSLWQVWTSKYIDRGATTPYTSRQNWHVIRLADVYLMRAEAMVELSQNPGLASQDINLLRARVGMADFDGAAMTMDEFRTALLEERAVELYMEGHRFFDLTRFGVYDEYCRNVLDVIPGTDGSRQAEDYTWPIPLIEVSANSNIN